MRPRAKYVPPWGILLVFLSGVSQYHFSYDGIPDFDDDACLG